MAPYGWVTYTTTMGRRRPVGAVGAGRGPGRAHAAGGKQECLVREQRGAPAAGVGALNQQAAQQLAEANAKLAELATSK
ncbi:hypothetical protein [Hymenobacter sp. AT01-02]|uniref:hypothetical protein n=1 Tax=Hymenobacter sp. AT01-02 TaxID=1571877 RepID=UPI0006E249F7|nr:hypothetical protein [Hymenobacter sp. AT01-02]